MGRTAIGEGPGEAQGSELRSVPGSQHVPDASRAPVAQPGPSAPLGQEGFHQAQEHRAEAAPGKAPWSPPRGSPVHWPCMISKGSLAQAPAGAHPGHRTVPQEEHRSGGLARCDTAPQGLQHRLPQEGDFFWVDGKSYRQCNSPCTAGVSCEAHPALGQEGVSFVTGLELTSQPLYEPWGSVPSAWQCAQTQYGTSLTS